MGRSPFPLCWPDGWKRTVWRQASRFERGGSFNAARDHVLHQLKRMGGSHVVITSNLPTNSKGVPYSAGAGLINDPGIAVWWVKGGKEHVIACDRWRTTYENMHALDLSLKAIRGIDRWGAVEMVERAFAGFAALPAGDGAEYVQPPSLSKRTWREVFSVNGLEKLVGARELLAIVRDRHRQQIKREHPDAGGSHEAAAALNAALDEAERELGDAS